MPSTFYFNSNAVRTVPRFNDLIREIPTYAFHASSSPPSASWDSNNIQDEGGLRAFTYKVNITVPVYLAMPRTIAERSFRKGYEFQKLVIYAFKPMPSASWMNGGYMVGPSPAIVFKDLTVTEITPIPQMRGIESIKEAQRNYLTKLLGTAMYSAVSVQLSADQADLVTQFDEQ